MTRPKTVAYTCASCEFRLTIHLMQPCLSCTSTTGTVLRNWKQRIHEDKESDAREDMQT